MTGESAELRRALAEKVSSGAVPLDPGWRAAVEAVPRDLFLDTALYQPDGLRWKPVRRAETGEEEWMRMVHSDRTWVTQVDEVDAGSATGAVSGAPTSSSTLPSLVVRTLQAAQLRGGEKVLETGTGTGYSTAILCHRLGQENITSIECDPGVAQRAADHLRASGYTPTLAVGDGLHGHQPGAEYDAIVATFSVRSIPPSWLWQIRDGGSITATLSGWMLASGLIRLTLDEEGVAHGRFTGETASYMLARAHERPPRPTFYRHPGRVRPTRVDPGLLQTPAGHFVAQLAAPSAELVHSGDAVILLDVATGSQAWTEPDATGWRVHQNGPMRLWDQAETALEKWQQAGAPDQSAFGLTATAQDQTVWLGSPDGPSWRLPT